MASNGTINGVVTITAPDSETLSTFGAALNLDMENGRYGRPEAGTTGPFIFEPASATVDFETARTVATNFPDSFLIISGEFRDGDYSERVEFTIHADHAHLNTYTTSAGPFEEIFPQALKEDTLFTAPASEETTEETTATETAAETSADEVTGEEETQ